MVDTDPQKITEAATAVMTALQPLTPEERSRVLQSAAALHGLAIDSPRRSSTVQGVTGDREYESGADVDVHREGKRRSIVEFLNDRQPATNAQRIACFAYYREHVEGKGSTFSKADLEAYFASAKLAKPGNYDRDFNKAVKAAWIHEDGSNSYLTQAGENAVKSGFGGKARPRGATGSRKKKLPPDDAQ